jgi:hypothetical protein
MFEQIWTEIKRIAAKAVCHRAMYLWVALTYGSALAGVEKEVVEAMLCALYAGLCLRG